MSNRKKTMLMMFVDYLLCFVFQLFGLFFLSPMLNSFWGFTAYSVVFTLILFGFLYSRAHNAARRDLKRKEPKSLFEGLIMAAPLAIFNLVIILFFALMQQEVIPGSDVVVKTLYRFPDNAPREVSYVYLLDTVTSVVRVWFGSLLGFAQNETSATVLLLSPALTFLAGFFGYFAGSRKFYLSETIVKVTDKIKEKFNE